MRTKEEQKKSRKEYYQSDKWKAYQKEYHQNNKEKLIKYGKIWKGKNPDYYQNNKEEIKVKRDLPENKAKAREYYQKNKDKPEAKAYRRKKKEERKARAKARDTPEAKEERKAKMNKQSRKAYLKKYGLTIEDYDKLAEQQNNKCAICGNNETIKQNGKETKLAVDHNWKTRKVRGLLCKNCNTTLGNLNEDISLFYKCIEYLKQHSN